MIIVPMTLVIVVFAVVNAVYSQPTDDLVLRKDEDRFYPDFLSSEGFVRSCLVNLSFAGMSLAIAFFKANDDDWYYWVFNPALALALNLAFGFVVSICLKSNRTSPWDGPRRTQVIISIIIGATLFLYAVAASVRREPRGAEANPKTTAMERMDLESSLSQRHIIIQA